MLREDFLVQWAVEEQDSNSTCLRPNESLGLKYYHKQLHMRKIIEWELKSIKARVLKLNLLALKRLGEFSLHFSVTYNFTFFKQFLYQHLYTTVNYI